MESLLRGAFCVSFVYTEQRHRLFDRLNNIFFLEELESEAFCILEMGGFLYLKQYLLRTFV